MAKLSLNGLTKRFGDLEVLREINVAIERGAFIALVGPSGCGKTTILNRWIADLLEADDYPSHRNLDRVHHVWQTSGKRIQP